MRDQASRTDESRDLERDAETLQAIYEEARDRLQIAVTAETDNRMRAKEDLIFREGQQWDAQPYATAEALNSPQLTINLTDALVRRVVNAIRIQRPRGKCHPVGDGADIDTAELINGLGRHIEYRSEASVAYDLAAEHAIVMGWGYLRLGSEYATPESFAKELRISPVRNPFTVFMDPAAIMPTAQDADWGIVTFKQKKTEFKRLHPRTDQVPWTDTGNPADREWEDKEEIRLAEYFRIVEKSAKLYLLRSPDGREFTRYDFELPSPEALEQSGTEVLDERESYRRIVERFELNGTKVVSRVELPVSSIPIIRVEGNAVDIDGKIQRRGMVRTMQDPARMINYAETAKIKRLGLAPQAPWIAAEGQLDGHAEWSATNTGSQPVLIYKPLTIPSALGGEILLPPPMRQPPAQIEAGFSEMVAGMRANLWAVSGMPHEPGVDAQGQVISGRALAKREKLSDQSNLQYYDNLVMAIARTWRLMLEWIPHVYSDERMQRIIQEDGTSRMVKINEGAAAAIPHVKNDLTVGRYEVVMDTGPAYETRREEGAETLMALLGTPLGPRIAEIGPDLVIRTLDHPYMQELADRFTALTPDGLKKLMETMDQRTRSVVQTLANQNAQLQQALQGLKSGVTKAHLETTERAQAGQTKAETQRFGDLLKAHTAIETAHIGVAGDLLKTESAQRHHEGEADKLVSEGEQ